MISTSVHFEAGYECQIRVLDISPTYALWLVGSGDLTLYFPTAEIRDAVRDALLKCPGCVARPEPEPAVNQAPPVGPNFLGGGGGSGFGQQSTGITLGTGAQPAIQAMDATEDWEMPF